MELFRQFLVEYKAPRREEYDGFSSDEDEHQSPFYAQYLESIKTSQILNMNVNCEHLGSFVPTRKLYRQLVSYPQVNLSTLDGLRIETAV